MRFAYVALLGALSGLPSSAHADVWLDFVNLRPDDRVWIGEMVKKHFPRPPAHTLIGISALAAPELLVEIEAIAVLD